jgi:hypothetical protein
VLWRFHLDAGAVAKGVALLMVTNYRWPTALVVTILMVAMFGFPTSAAAQNGECGPGAMGMLPGSNDVLVCDPDGWMDWAIAQGDMCNGAVVYFPSLFDVTYPNFFVGVPAYYTVDGFMKISFWVTIQPKTTLVSPSVKPVNYRIDSYNQAGNIVSFVESNTQYSDPYYHRLNNGGWHVRVNHTMMGASGGYFRVTILEDTWALNTLYAYTFRFSQPFITPDGWTPPPLCWPSPGEPTPTPSNTPSPTDTPEPTSTGTLTPTPSPTASLTPSITPTPTTGPSPTPTRTHTITLTPWSIPTTGLTSTPNATATTTPYVVRTATPFPQATPFPTPTLFSGQLPTLPAPEIPQPNFRPLDLEIDMEFPDLEIPNIEIPQTITPTLLSTPSITMPTAVATGIITQSLTPNATIAAASATRTYIVTSTEAIISGWTTGTVLLEGGVLSGTSAMSAAVTIAQGVASPIYYTRALRLYMPNLWPYIFIILLLLAWIIINMLARYALALFGVLYRVVDTVIRWFIPGLG